MSNDLHIFLKLLHRLTTTGKCIWIRSAEPGFVFCFIGDERITFALTGSEGTDNYVTPEQDIHAVLVRWRHRDLLFVQPVFMHPDLINLLRTAPTDEKRLQALSRQADAASFRALESLSDPNA